ncbi:hypothetical protein PFISCL1PPCAC_28390, partial [Pristionchus fissidentatus]
FKYELQMALNFSIERLVQAAKTELPVQESDDERGDETSSVKTEEEADSTTSPTSPPDSPKDGSMFGTAMSYFDVLMPHVQMASTNPLLSGAAGGGAADSTSATQLRLWSQQWLELLQQSSNAQLGDAAAGLFLQPFRKHKRIRTAFSPAQLVQLEKAFLANHYVVGTERKQLASRLSLSETQVKVWFQNRRTKHKRVKLDGSTEEIPSKEGSPMSP